jgi:pyrimidine-nucleoside phosphorylase
MGRLEAPGAETVTTVCKHWRMTEMPPVEDQLVRLDGDASMGRLVSAAQGGELTDSGVASLARVLANSGVCLPPDPKAADVASTGGPSSLTTLLCPLHLKARGLRVPKLGVTGRPAGGIDVLQTIPGYRAVLDIETVRSALDRFGYVHLLADTRWAPLDASLFAYRQRNGAQAVPALVIASILAKKLAAGVMGAGLEVRVAPHGNFGSDRGEARINAERYLTVARLLGLEPLCVLTDASSPYQPYIGRGEALIALDDILANQANDWLTAHAMLCRDIADATARVVGVDVSRAVGVDVLRSGHEALLAAHGVALQVFAERVAVARAAPRTSHWAQRDGWVHLDLGRLRDLLSVRQRAEPDGLDGTVPDPAGVILGAPAGSRVRRGDVIISVRVPPGEDGLRDSLAGCVYTTSAAIPDGSSSHLLEQLH